MIQGGTKKRARAGERICKGATVGVSSNGMVGRVVGETAQGGIVVYFPLIGFSMPVEPEDVVRLSDQEMADHTVRERHFTRQAEAYIRRLATALPA